MKKARWSWSALVLLVTVGAGACAGGGDTGDVPENAAAPTGQALPAGHPDIPEEDPEVAAMGEQGTVLETMDAGGYTYARLDVDGAEVWAAGPTTPLAEGTVVSLPGGVMMSDFHSSSLDRTFEKILFFGAYATPAATGPLTTGEALEVLNSAGYTYVKVELEGEELWVVGPETAVETGQTVGWAGGTTMRDFGSASLQRTFDVILFVESLTVR